MGKQYRGTFYAGGGEQILKIGNDIINSFY
jgi:hypothetical protein